LHPCLGDWTTHTPFDPHYFYQGAWLARNLAVKKPDHHVDIASSVLTISVLSGFVDTTFVDYRSLKANLSGLKSIPGDILNLPFTDNSIGSLSCMHVIEHIGLGRYGDPLDPMGSIKAAKELQRIVTNGGSLFLSVPTGRERVCFNAHRVFSPNTVVSMFSEMTLVDFAFVNDKGEYLDKQSLESVGTCEYGCGLYHFEKILL
jgi:SAM-dependent methyltransferase